MSLNKVKSIISAPKAKPKVKVINNIVLISVIYHLNFNINTMKNSQFEEGANCSYLFSGHRSFNSSHSIDVKIDEH